MTEFQDAKVIYDAFAEKYRDYSQSRSAYISAVDSLIIKKFKNRAVDVLDYGSGDGVRGVNIFSELHAKSLVQADVSMEMLKLCQKLGVAAEYWDVSDPSWSQKNRKFDLIMSLWNVFGHIPGTEERIKILSQLKQMTSSGGRLVLDVNNRHYNGYGRWNSLGRRIIDFIWPDYSRGDTAFTWEIDGVKYPARGHLFIFSELRYLFKQGGWEIEDWYAVDYLKGSISKKVNQGQLFFILK